MRKTNSVRTRPRPNVAGSDPDRIAAGRPRWSQRALPPHIARSVALTMIGLAVIGSYLLTPLPVAVGLTILAAARLWLWNREVKREAASGIGR